jgi:hypothetical protein
VKHATPAQIVPAAPEIALPQSQPRVDVAAAKTSQRESSTPEMTAVPAPALPAQNVPPPKQEEAAAASKKGLFWSAAMRAQGIAQAKESTETLAVPPVLRNLQKCQACGFPVSQGRAFCVECEEKQWRGQRIPAARSKCAKPSSSATGLKAACRSPDICRELSFRILPPIKFPTFARQRVATAPPIIGNPQLLLPSLAVGEAPQDPRPPPDRIGNY